MGKECKMDNQEYYISFALTNEFLGAIIVPAKTLSEALEKITDAGINPGGEAMGLPFTEDSIPEDSRALMMAAPRMKLMILEDLEEAGLAPRPVRDEVKKPGFDETRFNKTAEIACQPCNESIG